MNPFYKVQEQAMNPNNKEEIRMKNSTKNIFKALMITGAGLVFSVKKQAADFAKFYGRWRV